MYPDCELNRLAAYKVDLRRSIALHRVRCVEAATQVARPFVRLDRMAAFWKRLSPLARVAAMPLGLLATRVVFPKLKILPVLLRWVPSALDVARVFGAARISHPAPRAADPVFR